MRAALVLMLLAAPAFVHPAVAQPENPAPPFQPACISSGFGPRDGAGPRASNFHRGIDLPAPAGTWVRAIAPGRVSAIRRIGATGLAIDITHADGSVFRYAHLGQVAPALAEGKRSVAQGDVLGRIGRTGITYGTHLHLELVIGGERIDPEPHLGIARCPPRDQPRG
jgi:murein DD-endopeptidase MepM/ murein hydrolase activator NlpD